MGMSHPEVQLVHSSKIEDFGRSCYSSRNGDLCLMSVLLLIFILFFLSYLHGYIYSLRMLVLCLYALQDFWDHITVGTDVTLRFTS